MQLPTSTLFLLLFSFTSVLFVEGKYHPPSTASPDYQKCKHGVESDPSCIPLTSDESVSMIRDSKGRFLLLNEKHPELKSHIRQQTKSPYVTPTSTSELISTQSLDGTVVVVSPTPKAPALVAPELSTGAIPEPTQVAGRRSNEMLNNEGEQKFGESNNWGKPLIKRDSNDFIIPKIPFFAGSTSADQLHFLDTRDLLKRSPKDCLEETTIFSTATATSIQTVIQYQTVTVPAPSPTQTSINTLTSSQPNDNASNDVDQGQTQVGENVGNKKWGFNGGWGRPWKRQYNEYISTLLSSFYPAPTSVPAPAPAVSQSQSQLVSGDDTGNKKWGFSGGWGRPWKRQGLIDGNSAFTLFSFASPYSPPQSLPQTQSLIQAQAQTQISDTNDAVGNKKWGFSGGWGRPW